MGTIAVIFGISVYYLLPLSILHFNLGLMLSIFFSILLAMLIGLTLLATNLQGLLEVIFVYLFFFWEKPASRTLLRKNLGAHKRRNSLTAIIYALTLGCIVFLLVSANLQIQSISNLTGVAGVDMYLHYNTGGFTTELVDAVLREHSDSI